MIKKVLIILSLVTILLLAGLVAYFLRLTADDTYQARELSTKNSMETISLAMTMFYLSEERLPTKKEGVDILLEKNIIVEPAVDAWGNAFKYNPNSNIEGQYRLESFAADGEQGGEGNAADIVLVKNVFD